MSTQSLHADVHVGMMYNNQKGKEEDSPTLNVALFRAMEYCEDESQKHQLQKPDTKDYIYVMQFLGNSRKHESISPKKKSQWLSGNEVRTRTDCKRPRRNFSGGNGRVTVVLVA